MYLRKTQTSLHLVCICFPASSLHKTFCNQAVWILLRHGKSSGQNLPPSEVNASFSRFPSLFHSLPSTFLLLSLPLSISSNRAHGRLWSLRPSNPPTCNAICYIGMKWGKGFCDYYKKTKNKKPWICCKRTTSWCKTERHFSFQHFAIVLRGCKECLLKRCDRESIIPYVQFWPLVFIIITRKTSVKKCIAAKNRQMVIKHKAEVTRGWQLLFPLTPR